MKGLSYMYVFLDADVDLLVGGKSNLGIETNWCSNVGEVGTWLDIISPTYLVERWTAAAT
jgi:hypothetical protein